MKMNYNCCPPSSNFITLKRGPAGEPGSMGPMGNQGDQGSVGPVGPKGETGNTGPTGPKGITGTTGNVGPIGPDGNMGGFEPMGIYYGDYLYWEASLNKWVVGSENIKLGGNAGKTNQGSNAVAVGKEAGTTNQGGTAVAIGYQAGTSGQGDFAVAIGYQAGLTAQGKNSIAIGAYAGTSGQVDNSIILNATGSPLQADVSGFYVAPVRGLDPDQDSYYLFYDNTTKEIFYDPSESVITYNRQVIDTSGTYTFPNGVETVYISGVGGGGGGGAGNKTNNLPLVTAGGGGGGGGGAIYKYPINVIDVSFSVVIGKGGDGTSVGFTDGENGGTTSITYYISSTNTKTIYLGGGGGGTFGRIDTVGGLWINGIGGAGGSVTFKDNENVNANFTNPPSNNDTSLFLSAQTIVNQPGKRGSFIFPVILGSSGGSGFGTGLSIFTGYTGCTGGDCNGFFVGGTGGPATSVIVTNPAPPPDTFTYLNCGGGGGGASIFANGGKGGTDINVLGYCDGQYGSGGGGASYAPIFSGDGGNGRVIIEWY